MRFGTYYFLQAAAGRSSAAIIREELDQMVLSEALGYDAVWLTEHHFSDYGLSSAPGVLLASAAARTERIRFGLAVYVVPFHQPLRLAEETATLDILTGGRLVVGLGRGNRPIEFVGHGVDQDESRSRFEEGVEVLLRAWADEPVTFRGRHWSFDGIPVYPKPATRPHPPIAIAAVSPPSIAWAAARGYPIMSSGLTNPLASLVRQRDAYRDALHAAALPPEQVERLLAGWIVSKHVLVAPTDEEARAIAEGPERWFLDSFARSIRPDGLPVSPTVYREAAEFARRMAELSWDDLVEHSLLVGSPETVRQKVAELQAGGVGELLCWMNFGGIAPEHTRRSMRLFAEQVMPHFR